MTNKEMVGAIVYCEGAFNTPNGKTAHGLVRFTERYKVHGIIDSNYAGEDAGMILDNKKKNIPVLESLVKAYNKFKKSKPALTHFVIGLAPDGGRLDKKDRAVVIEAIKLGLNIDCGLHDFLSEDEEIAELSDEYSIMLRDVRKPPDRKDLHFFTGKIELVKSFKIAVLGTDSAIGKRTTAWLLVHALRKMGISTELIGTGQTAWMQSVKYGLILDSIINDFLSGEIEHAVWNAWKETKSDVLVLEGQGSLMNPAYPGGFELIAAGRPNIIILQHAPARIDYDGFPGYPIQPLPKQIKAIEIISGKPVVAVTINHESMDVKNLQKELTTIERTIGLPTYDVLLDKAVPLAKQIAGLIKSKKRSSKND